MLKLALGYPLRLGSSTMGPGIVSRKQCVGLLTCRSIGLECADPPANYTLALLPATTVLCKFRSQMLQRSELILYDLELADGPDVLGPLGLTKLVHHNQCHVARQVLLHLKSTYCVRSTLV